MNSRLGCFTAGILACLTVGHAAQAQTPDAAQSYYVPEAGPVGAPLQGADAFQYFRVCPNNDGGTSLPQDARIKLVLKDATGAPIVGLGAADIYIQFNGGTEVQGFSGDGADSIIANGVYNDAPLCPNLQFLTADASSDASGVAYITFAGGDPTSPGTTLRNPDRKWGHYDDELPVFANGIQLQGRLTDAGTNGEYVLRIKNYDFRGGLANGRNQGEVVSNLDFNSVKGHIGEPPDELTYWRDFDSNGFVGSPEFNMMLNHLDHDCGTPLSP